MTMIKRDFLFLIARFLGLLFFSMYNLYVDKECSLDFMGLIKERIDGNSS